MTPPRQVAAVVLAAGRGSRLGDRAPVPKPLLALRGRPLVAHALAAAVGSGLRPVLLVVGHDADAVAGAAPADVDIVRNERWADGISSSLHAALRAVDDRDDVAAVVVGLADQPSVGAAAWQRVAAAHDAGAAIAVATYAGRRGNPVMLDRSVWPDALALRGDEGARQLFRDHDVTEVPCDGTGNPDDVDTFEDLARIEERTN